MSDYDSDQGSFNGGSGSEPEVIKKIHEKAATLFLYKFFVLFLGRSKATIS